MSDIISAEHFKLTPPIKNHVMKYVEKLQALSPQHAAVRVFLIEDSPTKHFTVRFKVVLGKKELLVSEHGFDLYGVITAAGDQMVRKLSELKQRNLYLRRRGGQGQLSA